MDCLFFSSLFFLVMAIFFPLLNEANIVRRTEGASHCHLLPELPVPWAAPKGLMRLGGDLTSGIWDASNVWGLFWSCVEKLARTQFNHYQNFADCVTLQIASLCLMQPISHAANLTFSGPKGYWPTHSSCVLFRNARKTFMVTYHSWWLVLRDPLWLTWMYFTPSTSPVLYRTAAHMLCFRPPLFLHVLRCCEMDCPKKNL